MTSSNGFNREAERAVVGALILAGERIPEVSELLAPDDFHDPRHRILFRALVSLSKSGLPTDFVHLGAVLRGEGTFQTAGGNEYMLELANGVTSAAHLSHHAELVADAAELRRLAAAAQRLAVDAKALRPDGIPAFLASVPDRLDAAVRRARSMCWAPFPTDGFPEPLRSWVQKTARAIGVDEAVLAQLKLGVTAALIGNARRLRLTRTWVVPCILWIAVLQASGARKSAALRAAMRTFSALDLELRERTEDEREAWEEQKQGRPPPQRMLCLRDCTVEAAIARSRDNPRGLAYAATELAGLFRSLDQYRRGGKGNDRQRLLAMYDGDENSRDLVGESMFVRRCALSVFGVSTEAAFVGSLGKEAEEDGALARFWITMPPDPPALSFAELRAAPEPDDEAVEQIERKLAVLALDPADEPVVLDLSESGRRAFERFYEAMEHRIQAARGPLRAHLEKLREGCARVAIGLHCWRCLANARRAPGDPEPEALDRVDGHTIEQAACVTLWQANEAERAYGILLEGRPANGSRGLDPKRKLLDWIGRNGGSCTPSELVASGPRPRPANVEAAEAELRELEAAGQGTLTYASGSGVGGRPSLAFHLGAGGRRGSGSETPSSDFGERGFTSTSSPGGSASARENSAAWFPPEGEGAAVDGCVSRTAEETHPSDRDDVQQSPAASEQEHSR